VVRNSREPDGPVLRFTADEWRAFPGGVRNGKPDHFDVPISPSSQGRGNRYSFMKWVLADPRRTLRFALLVLVLTVAAVMAPIS
jgi:hypothetical protein